MGKIVLYRWGGGGSCAQMLILGTKVQNAFFKTNSLQDKMKNLAAMGKREKNKKNVSMEKL